MRKRAAGRIHTPGLLKSIVERLRGREQLLVRGLREWPLLLLRFPRGARAIAEELQDAWLHTLASLAAPGADCYRGMLRRMPPLVVVQLRERNHCTCLGHHHPAGTESRFTRNLAAETGGPVGEIDLAWEAIRAWQPNPLSALAAGVEPSFAALQFRTAMLTVLLHELEHLAYPDRHEQAVRGASDAFYTAALDELLRQEGAVQYGMAHPARSG